MTQEQQESKAIRLKTNGITIRNTPVFATKVLSGESFTSMYALAQYYTLGYIKDHGDYVLGRKYPKSVGRSTVIDQLNRTTVMQHGGDAIAVVVLTKEQYKGYDTEFGKEFIEWVINVIRMYRNNFTGTRRNEREIMLEKLTPEHVYDVDVKYSIFHGAIELSVGIECDEVNGDGVNRLTTLNLKFLPYN